MQSTACAPPIPNSSHSDHDLIQAALAGDPSGYDELILRYQDRLFRTVLLDVNCAGLAEDIVQDAFVRAFMHLDSFRGQSGFYTWLYRIALNARRTYFRKYQPHLPLELLGDNPDQVWTEPHESPPQSVERGEECREVRAAMGRMDEPYRTILVLREFEGFDYQTIAELLQIKIGTVRSRLSRAREQLRCELTDYLHQPARSHRQHARLPR